MAPTYSNPRLNAAVENWPTGGKRCTATFAIEQTKVGERGVRTTTGAPRKLTYGRKARIVDGDDGHVYIAVLDRLGNITVMAGDMRHIHDYIHHSDPRYSAACASLFDKTK